MCLTIEAHGERVFLKSIRLPPFLSKVLIVQFQSPRSTRLPLAYGLRNSLERSLRNTTYWLASLGA